MGKELVGSFVEMKTIFFQKIENQHSLRLLFERKLHDLHLLCEDEAHTVREYYTGTKKHECHTCKRMTGEMYWIQFDDGCTDSLDECYCWQCTLDSLQANQEAATLSAASDCGSSESDDDDAEEEATASDAPSVYEDSDASSDDFDWSEDESSAGPTEFQGDYWIASKEALRGWEGINVRREPCMSSLILGTVETGDKIQATRERFGSWMKVVPWEGKNITMDKCDF